MHCIKTNRILLYISLLFIGLLLPIVNTVAKNIPRADYPAVIMYHDIRPDIVNHFDVSVESFEKQISHLTNLGYQSLSMDEYYQGVTGAIKLPEKSVLITFDDGYKGNYDYAMTILEKYNMKATFFIHVAGISNHLDKYQKLSLEEIIEIENHPLFHVYSHTVNHPDLTKIDIEKLREELILSKKFFEDTLGSERNFLAYPFGYYDQRVIEEVEAAGYQLAFAVKDLGLFEKSSIFSIPRIYMGTIMNDLELFNFCVQNYHKIPSQCFEERWQPIDSRT